MVTGLRQQVFKLAGKQRDQVKISSSNGRRGPACRSVGSVRQWKTGVNAPKQRDKMRQLLCRDGLSHRQFACGACKSWLNWPLLSRCILEQALGGGDTMIRRHHS